MLLSSLIKQLENFAGVMNFVIFPMFFASSALYPLWRVREGSPWLATACELNPFTHAVELIRFAFYGQVNWLSLGVVAGCTVVVPRRGGDRLRSGTRHADAAGRLTRVGRLEMRMIERRLIAALALCASACFAGGGEAADRLRIAIQKTGTASWEIALMKARGLDKAADLEIETTELASTDAGKIALEGGAADMIISDWLWVARERGLGDKLLFTPYSNALGAVMAAKDSPVHSIGDLAGRSIGVAGGPIDKSWLLLRAAGLRAGLDLTRAARPVYGAPPLVAEKLAQGETDTALEFWNFSADLETRGFLRAIEMADVEKALGATGPVAMTGYVFSESFAATPQGRPPPLFLRRRRGAQDSGGGSGRVGADQGAAQSEGRRGTRNPSQALSRRPAETQHRRGSRGRPHPV